MRLRSSLFLALFLAGCSGHYGPPAVKSQLPRAVLRSTAPVPQFDKAQLRPGDVLLYAPSSLVGDIIAVKTGRLKSHVEAYVGSGMVFAAREEGVNLYPVRIDPSLASVRRHPHWERFNTNAAMASIKLLIGTKYDTCGLFSFFDPWHPARHVIRVCSTVDCIYVRGGGLDPFNSDLDSNGVTPAAFFETGGMFTIWRNPVIDRAFQP